MINPTLNIHKAFREQGTKCMKTTFFAITQPHIRTISAKKNTRVLSLSIFYNTRKNTKNFLKVLSCVIYKIIRNYFCIDYLACESIFLWTTCFFWRGFKTLKQKLWKNIGNYNSIFVNELDVLSLLFEEHKSYCHIKMS